MIYTRLNIKNRKEIHNAKAYAQQFLSPGQDKGFNLSCLQKQWESALKLTSNKRKYLARF